MTFMTELVTLSPPPHVQRVEGVMWRGTPVDGVYTDLVAQLGNPQSVKGTGKQLHLGLSGDALLSCMPRRPQLSSKVVCYQTSLKG